MAVAEGVLAERARTLSPALVVTLRAQHLSICGPDDDGSDLELALPDLALLEELVRNGHAPVTASLDGLARRTGLDPERLRSTLEELRVRGLLVEDAAAAPAVQAERVVDRGEGATPAPFAADEELVVVTPLVLRLSPGGFEHVDHDGRVRARVDAVELAAASEFRRPATRAAAFEAHREHAGASALDAAGFDVLIDRLAAAGLLRRDDFGGPDARENRMNRLAALERQRLVRAVDRGVSEHEAAEGEREQQGGTARTKIVPVDTHGSPIPLALGMIVAYAQAYDGGRLADHYQFYPEWVTRHRRLRPLTEQPGIFLFSNYIWSHHQNLAMSEHIKRLSPGSVTIHGGPDTPKYEGDAANYFLANPHVDVAVGGEGEATFAEALDALQGALGDGDGPPDLSALHDVAGLSFRERDRVVRTPDRERIADLDTIPSPFLTGVFDVHAIGEPHMAIVETNRGCPYGCTFCDWGSATLSRIRKFDLDRIFAELEWCAKHSISRVMLADANFGIFERDVEIAEKAAELKGSYGYPRVFGTNYAKNTTKHLKKIVSALAGAGILTEGLLSLQSMDTDTLDTVRRSNIKTEKYDQLAREFRSANLPLFIDLMVGLPGATTESFRADLQGCIDREVTAKIYPTELLVNSPMNDPAYREQNKIETTAPPLGARSSTTAFDGYTRRALLISTSSYTREDYDEMMQLRQTYMLCENFAVLRQVTRHLRQELGLLEVEFYDRLRREAAADQHRWPTIAFALHVVPFLGVAPVSWRLFIDEVHTYAVEVLGAADDDALRTVLEVQHALLPSREREFPQRLELAHDYAAWYHAMIEVKDDGYGGDWPSRVPRLRDLPPATFVVDDPHNVCERGVGYRIINNFHADWELGSPVARAMPGEHQDVE